jgi:hypothetical protein
MELNAAFGPCSKMLAKCPECGNECDEYRAPKQGLVIATIMFHTTQPAAPAAGDVDCKQ